MFVCVYVCECGSLYEDIDTQIKQGVYGIFLFFLRTRYFSFLPPSSLPGRYTFVVLGFHIMFVLLYIFFFCIHLFYRQEDSENLETYFPIFPLALDLPAIINHQNFPILSLEVL